jgi:Raf kinase inhibitor-like YbhB/YbcL family protein
MTLQLWSEAFAAGGAIPPRFTADGDNVSPPLRWSNVPTHARELALVLEDLDADEAQPFLHWIVWRIPTRLDGLPEGLGAPQDGSRWGEALEGANSLDHVGYDGPEPPDERAHRYRFRLLALDAPLESSAEPLDAVSLERATRGHVVEEAELVGTYARPE